MLIYPKKIIKNIIYFEIRNDIRESIYITYAHNVFEQKLTIENIEILLNHFNGYNISLLHIYRHLVDYEDSSSNFYREQWFNSAMISGIEKDIHDEEMTSLEISKGNTIIFGITVKLPIHIVAKQCPKIFSRI